MSRARLAAAGVTPLVVRGAIRVGDWFPWCIVAAGGGIALALGAVARELILRAPAGKYRRPISAGFLGGIGLGADGGGHGDGGGDGGGGH